MIHASKNVYACMPRQERSKYDPIQDYPVGIFSPPTDNKISSERVSIRSTYYFCKLKLTDEFR
jgi:hypothetical protein